MDGREKGRGREEGGRKREGGRQGGRKGEGGKQGGRGRAKLGNQLVVNNRALSPIGIRGLCRMKMLPVMILANYHSSARSAVSERSNSSARLVSQCPNSNA